MSRWLRRRSGGAESRTRLGLLGALALATACSGSSRPIATTREPPTKSPDAGAETAAEPAPLSKSARIEDESNTIAVFKLAAPATVFVTQKRVVVDFYAGTAEEIPAGSGSGFIWDKAGHVVTNYHVIRNAERLNVSLHDQRSYAARVVGVEPRRDIAVLHIDAPSASLSPIRVNAKVDVEVGQKTIAIGNPFGLDYTLTTGVVSAIGREVKGVGGVTIPDMIQTDAAINPGNSGGPLLNSAGELIGMNTMIYSRSGAFAGIGFAVPAPTIARVVPQIIKSGRAAQVGMGIRIDPARRLERRLGMSTGVIVLGTFPDTPAARAGLRPARIGPDGVKLGDVIVAIDGKRIDDYDALYNALDKHQPGDTVTVSVRRDGRVVDLRIELVVVQ